MTASFQALRVHAPGDQRIETLTLDQLTPATVTIEVHYSSINYKDALAVTGRGKILKRFPLSPGIDAAGKVLSSEDPRFHIGQEVIVTGCGIGETEDGGYSQRLKVNPDYLIPKPQGLSLREAMILGTAGFTAALALKRMLHNGQRPDQGPILVTGASGGVGSFAVELFARSGFTVHALSGKKDAAPALKALGASEVLSPEDLQLGARPLESVKFGGAVDNVGGELLAKVLAHTQLWGNVASIGLAASHELHTTVMPFILRGVSLLGTSSNNTPWDLRQEIWRELSGSWKPKNLEATVNRTVTLNELSKACEDLMDRRVRGRMLVQLFEGGQP